MSKLSLSRFKPKHLAFGASFRRGMITLLLGVSVLGAAVAGSINYHTPQTQDVVVNSVGQSFQGTNLDGSKKIQHHIHVTRTDGTGESYYLKVSQSTACAAKPGYRYQTVEKGWGIKFFDDYKTAPELRTPAGFKLHGIHSPNYDPNYCNTKPAYPYEGTKPHAEETKPSM
ncbi:MAG: hypothetical protein Alpg2KO_12090 [Alphaproteobacteria bacterium]